MANNYNSFTPKISSYNDYTNESYEENLFTSLISLLNTPKGSHPYDPNFGVDLRSFILSVDSGNVSSLIDNAIKTAIQIYLPELFPYIAVVTTRELHPSGIGYKYKANVVVQDLIISFTVGKQGTLMYGSVSS